MTTLKMNRRSVILLGTLIVGAALLFGYEKVSGERALTVVDTHASLVHDYTTVAELKQEADIIAEVQINQSQATKYKDLVFTISEAKVMKTFKGTVSDNLNILETGGTFQDTKYMLNGNEAFSTGNKAIVFLERYEGPIAENAYVILGVYEGKFQMNGSKLTASKEISPDLNRVHSLIDLQLK